MPDVLGRISVIERSSWKTHRSGRCPSRRRGQGSEASLEAPSSCSAYTESCAAVTAADSGDGEPDAPVPFAELLAAGWRIRRAWGCCRRSGVLSSAGTLEAGERTLNWASVRECHPTARCA
jgi:hypothetical protein